MSEITPWLHVLVAPVLMVLVYVGNSFWAHRRTEVRISVEASRLQAALTAELHALSELYRANIRLLSGGEVALLSTRAPMAVFRGNLPRLTMLDTGIIKCLIAIHAQNEHIEMRMAARCKSTRGGSATVYHFEKNDAIASELKPLFSKALRNVSLSIKNLEGDVPVSTPSDPARVTYELTGRPAVQAAA